MLYFTKVLSQCLPKVKLPSWLPNVCGQHWLVTVRPLQPANPNPTQAWPAPVHPTLPALPPQGLRQQLTLVPPHALINMFVFCRLIVSFGRSFSVIVMYGFDMRGIAVSCSRVWDVRLCWWTHAHATSVLVRRERVCYKERWMRRQKEMHKHSRRHNMWQLLTWVYQRWSERMQGQYSYVRFIWVQVLSYTCCEPWWHILQLF